MKRIVKRGAQSVMERVFIQDNSVTTGAGLTGLTSASTNLQIATIRELDSAVTIYTGANIEAQTTIGAYQAPSASSKIRFKAVDGTNMPGVYELQFHNSAAGAFGSGDASKDMQIYVWEITTTALKIAPNVVEIQLVAVDTEDAVRLGLTALPNAIPQAAGGLITSTAGSQDIDEAITDIDEIVASTAGLTFTGAGKVDASVRDWLGTAPAAVTSTGHFIQVAVERWLTDDAAGTPAALTATGKFLQTAVLRWLSDDAAGTPAALTATGKFLQAALLRWLTDDAGGTPSALASGGVPVASNVKKNVALSNFEFLMVASSDHLTPLTGLTVTAQISKDHGAFGACTNAPVEVANGIYYINLIQAEMNANIITLYFTAATADGQFVTIVTTP